MADDTPQIPASRVPLLEGERDIMSREWYRYFNNLQGAALSAGYGVFTKTTDATPVAADTEYLLTFDNTQVANGISIGTPASRIVVSVSGLYQFSATVQLTSGSSNAKTVAVWFKLNGTAVANTSRLVTVNINGGHIPLPLVETFSLQAGDYIEMAYASDDTDITVETVNGLTVGPDAPAIVLTVQQAQQ